MTTTLDKNRTTTCSCGCPVDLIGDEVIGFFKAVIVCQCPRCRDVVVTLRPLRPAARLGR
jgi:hypothetical protein